MLSTDHISVHVIPEITAPQLCVFCEVYEPWQRSQALFSCGVPRAILSPDSITSFPYILTRTRPWVLHITNPIQAICFVCMKILWLGFHTRSQLLVCTPSCVVHWRWIHGYFGRSQGWSGIVPISEWAWAGCPINACLDGQPTSRVYGHQCVLQQKVPAHWPKVPPDSRLQQQMHAQIW